MYPKHASLCVILWQTAQLKYNQTAILYFRLMNNETGISNRTQDEKAEPQNK